MDREANSSQHNLENLKRKQAIELLENWKEKLKEKNEEVKAQISEGDLREKLKERIQNLKQTIAEKVGKLTREIIHKKVKIEIAM